MNNDRTPRRIVRFAVLCCLLVAPAVEAADWPFLRGPRHDGASDETGWQAVWPAAGPRIAWRGNVGIGAASFVVAGHRVVTMGNIDDRDVVVALNAADGAALWTFAYDCALNPRQFEGGTASTPTIDGDRVYTLSWAGHLHALALDDGRLLWARHLVDDFKGVPPRWQYAGSVLSVANMLIVDAGGRGASTLALDPQTGATIWQAGDDPAGYATPIPFDHTGGRGVMVFKAQHAVALDLADGRELWRIPWETSWDVNASSPLVVGDYLFLSSGYASGRGALYRLAEAAPRQVWVNSDFKTKMSTGVHVDGVFYGISEKGGVLMGMDAVTGRTVWSQPGFGRFGTLTLADGKLITLTENGTLIVVQADREAYRELASAPVLEGRCWVMPVLANGRIYAKTNLGNMVCVDVSGNDQTADTADEAHP